MTAALLAGALAVGAAPSASPADALADALRRIEAAEAALKDVTVGFRQETRLKATGDVSVTTGTLALQRDPQRFRVTFISPASQIAVFDGKILQLYLPDAGQAFRQPATETGLEKLIGLNPAAASRSFRQGFAPALLSRDAKVCRLEFRREGGGGPAAVWRLTVSASTWLLAEAAMETPELAVVLRCSGYRVNRGLPAKTFSLALPKGTDVQEGLPQLMGGGR